jgi:hypothetical protein
MADLDGIRALVQDAIDKGATTVEEVHTTIAAMPLEALKKVEPLRGLAEAAEAVTMASIGNVYDTIRQVNEQAGEVAKQLLGGDEGADTAS